MSRDRRAFRGARRALAHGAHRFARFDYEGETMSIGASYLWIFDAWMDRSPWRAPPSLCGRSRHATLATP